MVSCGTMAGYRSGRHVCLCACSLDCNKFLQKYVALQMICKTHDTHGVGLQRLCRTLAHANLGIGQQRWQSKSGV